MDTSRQQIDLDSVLQELKILYQRATTASPSDVDLLAIDLFASMVQQYESIMYEATKIIAEKFNSANSDEVLLALNVLEECMSKCGPKFHNEIGKFRFLNELIRLVSPVYQGDKTPKTIRDKILDLMLLWTVNYPQETKIKEAYDMLLKRGVRHEFVKAVQIQNKNDPTKAMAPQERAPPQPDLSDKLKKLLQSTNPSDHKAANLLIQNMVKEKERRTEVQVRRKLQLKEVYENAHLLNEMLDQTGSASGAEVLTDDVLVTLNDLYEACKKLQPTILILVGDLNETELLEEALEANDLLTDVLGKYSKLILKQAPAMCSSQSSSYLIPSLESTQNTMDELNEIFSAQSTEVNPILMPNASQNTNLLEPTSALITDSNHTPQGARNKLNKSSEVTKISSPVFEHLSNGVRNENTIPLPMRLFPVNSNTTNADNGNKNSQSKLMNFDTEITELVSGLKLNMRKMSPENSINDPDLDDDIILEQPDEVALPLSNDLLTHDFDPLSQRETVETEIRLPKSKENVNKPLSEIIVDLNSIQPHDQYQPRCILDESNGLKIMLNFTKDHPRPDVVVLVVTTTNHNTSPLYNYQFEASVTKPCKIHLQKVSGNELPAVKPFRPPSEDITQILLLSNPERKATKIMCIISYVLDNDPDPVKEFVEINDLPDLF